MADVATRGGSPDGFLRLNGRVHGYVSSAAMRSSWNPAAIFLVLLMGAGSVLMWLGVPVGLIYLASKISSSSSPSLGPYLLVLLGLPVGMAIIGKCLGWLDRRHQAITRQADGSRRTAPWMKSMRGDAEDRHRGGVLDKVMIISVAVALLLFGVWFFGFAGSSLVNS